MRQRLQKIAALQKAKSEVREKVVIFHIGYNEDINYSASSDDF
jgi:hypothetical protein